MTPSPIAGTWHLHAWTSLINGANDGHPMGKDAKGQIIYTEDGHMSAFLMRADFHASGSAATADTSLAYGGTWQFDNGKITHQVSFASLPHWVGRPLVRTVDRDGDTMILRTEPEFSKSGNRYEHALVWKKVGSSF